MEVLVAGISMTLKKYYKGKRVLVTGHTGFKGGWLVALLAEFGATIKGYALPPENPDGIYTAIGADRLCESVLEDIRNRDKLEKEILVFEPDHIFHLAAQPLVRYSYQAPAETFEVNVLGTAYLLDAVKKLTKPCQVVIITTDKVYKNLEEDIAYKESDQLEGYDPYSSSKACTELVVASYRNSFFSEAKFTTHRKTIVTARAGNVIGGGDYARDRIIPDLIRSLSKGQELLLRNPNSVRPWQHVLEPLVGYLQLSARLENNPLSYSPAYNFGPLPGDHLTVLELVKLAIRIWGEGSYTIQRNDDLHEANLLKLDIGLATKELNWMPKYTSAKAIEETINWYKAGDKRTITKHQITTYFKE